MSNRVTSLAALLKPKRPRQIADWSKIEHQLGTVLPDDFKEFWSYFSTGCLGFRDKDETLFVPHSPFSAHSYLGFPSCVTVMSDSYRSQRDQFADQMPHKMWPEPGGLLSFAHDSNGVDYYLHSSTWHVWGEGDGVDENYGLGFSDFLWELAHNNILIAPPFQGVPGSAELTVWTEE